MTLGGKHRAGSGGWRQQRRRNTPGAAGPPQRAGTRVLVCAALRPCRLCLLHCQSRSARPAAAAALAPPVILSDRQLQPLGELLITLAALYVARQVLLRRHLAPAGPGSLEAHRSKSAKAALWPGCPPRHLRRIPRHQQCQPASALGNAGAQADLCTACRDTYCPGPSAVSCTRPPLLITQTALLLLLCTHHLGSSSRSPSSPPQL